MKTLTLFAACLSTFVLVGISHAEHVTIDDFDVPSQIVGTSVEVYSGTGPLAVDRTVSAPFTAAGGFGGFQMLLIPSFGGGGVISGSLKYDVSGGDFGDVFADFHGNPGFDDAIDGITLGYLAIGDFDLTVKIDGADFTSTTLTPGGSPFTIEDETAFDSATSIEFVFSTTAPDLVGGTKFLVIGGDGSNAFIATPEPTSALLFGSLLAGVGFFRRRR